MPDSQAIDAERRLQLWFRFGVPLAMLVIAVALITFRYQITRLPNRFELGPLTSPVEFAPVRLDEKRFGPLKLAGAWSAASDDRRFGGFSGLALYAGQLVAISDSGVVARFPKPVAAGATVTMDEVPGGVGGGHYKVERDSEGLLADARGRGWWVPFEYTNEIWLFDRRFTYPIERISFGWGYWPLNRGIEGIANESGALLLFPEDGDRVVRVTGKVAETVLLTGLSGSVSDATRLPDGRLVVVARRLTLSGFENAVVELGRAGAGFAARRRYPLGVGRLDNVEGIAGERLPDGRVRLWLITDDNLQRPLRTLILAVDLPADAKR
jgi:hypothetical protein